MLKSQRAILFTGIIILFALLFGLNPAALTLQAQMPTIIAPSPDPNRPTPAPSATRRILPTSSNPQRATLPPSWTPTFTPSATATPTITPTFTASPTRTQAQFCDEEFSFTWLVFDGGSYTPLEDVDFFTYTPDPQRLITLEIHNLDTDQRETLEFSGAAPVIGRFSMDLPTGPGAYDYTARLLSPTGSILCARQGNFILRPPTLLELMRRNALALRPTPTP